MLLIDGKPGGFLSHGINAYFATAAISVTCKKVLPKIAADKMRSRVKSVERRLNSLAVLDELLRMIASLEEGGDLPCDWPLESCPETNGQYKGGRNYGAQVLARERELDCSARVGEPVEENLDDENSGSDFDLDESPLNDVRYVPGNLVAVAPDVDGFGKFWIGSIVYLQKNTKVVDSVLSVQWYVPVQGKVSTTRSRFKTYPESGVDEIYVDCVLTQFQALTKNGSLRVAVKKVLERKVKNI